MSKEKLYWPIVLISLIYFLWKNRQNLLGVLIILCFYSGLANLYGKIIENPYKIIIIGLSLFIVFKYNALAGLKRKERIVLFFFVLFSFSFFLSGFLNNDSLNIIFSQYGKYITAFCIYFLLNKFIKNSPDDIEYYKGLFFSMLNLQIILSLFKWYTIGIQEWTVGSIVNEGGGEATPLPVLGFMLLWLHKQGELNKKDWIYILLLLIISFVSLKRAIWFIMPVFVLLFIYYVPKKVRLKKLIYFAPFIPLIFYLGVRFNPTLNKEGKFGGSFDAQYVVDYVMSYNFGKTEDKSAQLGQGRGGANLLLWSKLLGNRSTTSHDYFGYGLEKMYTSDYETFDKYKFGLSNKGAATGIFQTYVTAGFVGILFTLIFLFTIVRLITNTRLRFTIGLFVFYDYIFYNGLVLRTPALFILLLFIILFSNFLADDISGIQDTNVSNQQDTSLKLQSTF